MNIRSGWLGLTFVCGFALVTACGGSSENKGNGGGSGSSAGGKAGSSSGGSAGSNSSSGAGGSSKGGSASNNGGSSSNGGSQASGGFNVGGFNVGGEGIDPSDFMCNPVPEVGSTCDAEATPCTAGTSVCYCQSNKWACTDLGGQGGTGGTGQIGNVDCPDTKPMDGTDCGDDVGFCPYGDGQFSGCACYQGSWTCG
jgi:hypothetical protein